MTDNASKARDGRNILYDINKIKEIGHGDVSSKSPKAQRDSHINPDFYEPILSQKDTSVNANSLKNSHQSQEFKNWFGDWQNDSENASKVVNADGTPKIMYHGSPNSFTAFDKKKAKASGLYGKGFYFTDSESHAGQYGDKYAVYLNIQNPLEPGKNNLTKKQLMNFLEAVAENGEDYDIWNYGTENIAEIADSIYKNDAFSVIQDVNATAIGDFSEAIKLFNEINGTDYDGIITPSETVVYEPTQIKSADPVTYDNDGNIIPLSERFKDSNVDIRYSSKDTDDNEKNKF